jgi:predicted nucleotidyltransferase
MAPPIPNDPILTRFRAALAETYGDRLERAILYGSRARGDHRPDSDYDIAVFIKEPGEFTVECARLAEVTTDILFDTGAVISATPFPAGTWRERTGFMHELREDGFNL